MTTVMVLEASKLVINSTDYSARCQKIELACEVAELDVTTFASGGWKEVTGGLASAGLKIEFLNDRTDNELDEDMWTLLIGKVPTTFYVNPDDAATSASNPKYSGSVLVNKWMPLTGAPGDLDTVSVDWPVSGAVTRGTT